jgi:hypothetical protein
MTTNKTPSMTTRRIGPQMLRAVEIAARSPGCSILYIASRLHIAAENGRNNALGYNPVHRAVRAGLLHLGAAHGRSGYSVTVTLAGSQALS